MTTNRMKLKIQQILGLAMLAVLLPINHRSIAQSVPSLLNFQGFVQARDGGTLPTGDYTVEFSIFSTSEGGIPLWGPQTFNDQVEVGFGPRIPFVRGHFNALLGPMDQDRRPLETAFHGGDRWIEIKIDEGVPSQPRQRIATTPYSFRTSSAAEADIAHDLSNVAWASIVERDSWVRYDALANDVKELVESAASEVRMNDLEDSESTNSGNRLVGGAVTLNSTGRPVFVGLTSDTRASNPENSPGLPQIKGPAHIYGTVAQNQSQRIRFEVRILRNETVIYRTRVDHQFGEQLEQTMRIPSSSIWVIDLHAPAGANRYTVEIQGEGADQAGITNTAIVAYEL